MWLYTTLKMCIPLYCADDNNISVLLFVDWNVTRKIEAIAMADSVSNKRRTVDFVPAKRRTVDFVPTKKQTVDFVPTKRRTVDFVLNWRQMAAYHTLRFFSAMIAVYWKEIVNNVLSRSMQWRSVMEYPDKV